MLESSQITFMASFFRFLLLSVLRPVFLSVGALFRWFHQMLFAGRIDDREQKPSRGSFPNRFRVQRIGVEAAKAIADLPAPEIAAYFREHPATAKALVSESYDKRYSPSTFISEEGNELFRVGWYSTKMGYECVRDFPNLADAATDYLLFSLGKGRWKPPN